MIIWPGQKPFKPLIHMGAITIPYADEYAIVPMRASITIHFYRQEDGVRQISAPCWANVRDHPDVVSWMNGEHRQFRAAFYRETYTVGFWVGFWSIVTACIFAGMLAVTGIFWLFYPENNELRQSVGVLSLMTASFLGVGVLFVKDTPTKILLPKPE